MTNEAHAWYAVQTQPHAEDKASRHLVRQGFEVYLPRFARRRRHARRTDTIAKALFPGYLFVAMDVGTQRWRSVNSTIGVRKLICNGEMPIAVCPSIVDELKSRHDDLGFVKLDLKPQFMVGDKIRVVDGVFSGALAIYEGMSDVQRVAILLDLLGRKVRVKIEIDSIAAA